MRGERRMTVYTQNNAATCITYICIYTQTRLCGCTDADRTRDGFTIIIIIFFFYLSTEINITESSVLRHNIYIYILFVHIRLGVSGLTGRLDSVPRDARVSLATPKPSPPPSWISELDWRPCINVPHYFIILYSCS